MDQSPAWELEHGVAFHQLTMCKIIRYCPRSLGLTSREAVHRKATYSGVLQNQCLHEIEASWMLLKLCGLPLACDVSPFVQFAHWPPSTCEFQRVSCGLRTAQLPSPFCEPTGSCTAYLQGSWLSVESALACPYDQLVSPPKNLDGNP